MREVQSKSDYIRLNLASVLDLPNMFIEKYKEFYNIEISDLKIDVKYYDSVSNSHGCPLNGVMNWGGLIENAPRSYPGWQGQISLFAKGNIKPNCWNEGILLNEVLFSYKGFKGFHLGGGCHGRLNQYKMEAGFYFFLDDFPLIKKNINKHKTLNSFSNKKISWENFNNLNYSA